MQNTKTHIKDRMKLICNKIGEHHLSEIIEKLDSADEIIFCVAFLKNSGLNSII
jgi:HKD family nuclease